MSRVVPESRQLSKRYNFYWLTRRIFNTTKSQRRRRREQRNQEQERTLLLPERRRRRRRRGLNLFFGKTWASRRALSLSFLLLSLLLFFHILIGFLELFFIVWKHTSFQVVLKEKLKKLKNSCCLFEWPLLKVVGVDP